MTIRISFSAAFVCAAIFATAASLHAAPVLVGGALALFFFALAVAAGALAVSLDGSNTVTEPRKPLGPTHPAPLPPDAVPRRELFGKMWAATAAAFGVVALVPLVALVRRPRPPATAWRRGARLVTSRGRRLRVDDVAVGGIETVFPEGAVDAPQSAVVLLRVDEKTLALPLGREAGVCSGNLAYSKVCTHAGCPVALYRHASAELACPCHQSVFDVKRGAKPVSGPAARALPQLPLAVDGEGYLIAGGDFSGPVGPDEWDRPV